jgi:hypothetical protein
MSCEADLFQETLSWKSLGGLASTQQIKVFLYLVFCGLLIISSTAAAQEQSDARVQVMGPGFCQDNEVTLDVIAQNARPIICS